MNTWGQARLNGRAEAVEKSSPEGGGGGGGGPLSLGAGVGRMGGISKMDVGWGGIKRDGENERDRG